MRTLALDLATTTGWAFGVNSEPPLYGSARMGKRSCSVGECFLGLDSWLTEKLDETMPDVVIFEAPIFFGRGDVMIVQRLMGLAAITELIALKRGLRVYRAEGSTVTKAFTGRGRFPGGREEKKRATIETCRHYGWSPTDDNQADALALLHYAQSILSHGAVERSAGPLFAGDAPQTRIGRRPGVA